MRACGKCSRVVFCKKTISNKIYFYRNAIYDIIIRMRKRNLILLPVLSCLMSVPAMAGWQYDGEYVGDGWYMDDGARFVISVRGGAAAGFGAIKNDVGELSTFYYINDENNLISESVCFSFGGENGCLDAGYKLAGYGNIGDLPPTKDFESFAFAAGASIGWTLPGRPQWRFEAGWDHIMKSDYNATPMYSGVLQLSGGALSDMVADAGSVQSTVQTDVISAMAYYDFFDGLQKPLGTMIPYVGLGIGYADTTTTMILTDTYGNLSGDNSMDNYGVIYEDDPYKLVDFYKSEYSNSNIAGIIAAGFSYGLTDRIYMDMGARLTYIPKIKWVLTNEDDTQHRDWIRAENLIYINMMLGLRFEF